MIFKGYIPTSGKKSLVPFKDEKNLKSFDEVMSENEYAGVLASGIILVDIDRKKDSDRLLNIIKAEQIKCKVYETHRGKHFYFRGNIKSNKTDAASPIGLHADYKTGNKASYGVLKLDGVQRPVIYDTAGPSEDLDEIPKWLIPFDKKADDIYFADMEQGDGRNSELYSHILRLQRCRFSKSEIKKTLRLINRFIFRKPLPEEELNTILRDDAFDKPQFFEGKNFLFDNFAWFMKDKYHIKKINGQLHTYQNGIYVADDNLIRSRMIEELPRLNQSKRNEVFEYIKLISREEITIGHYNKIAFKNGIYDTKQKKLLPFSPDYIITNKIPHNYNPDAINKEVDRFLNNISGDNAKIRGLLEEVAGYCMFRRNNMGKSVVLTGAGSNGKSTYIKIIKKMLGNKNTSSLDLKLLNDRFSTIMLYNKMANLGDDISDEFIADTSYFKKISTGETISCEQKGQPKFDFEPFCKLIFSCNSIPKLGKGKDTEALSRRLIIIPFNRQFYPGMQGYDPFLCDKLTSENAIEYFIRIALQGLDRVLNKGFSTDQTVAEEIKDFKMVNNPLNLFMEELQPEDYINQPVTDVYVKYRRWCFQNSHKQLSQTSFSTDFKRDMKVDAVLRYVNGKKVRVYEKKPD